MAWERVIIQDGVEILVGSGTEREAQDWLEFKRTMHDTQNGWRVTLTTPTTVEASRAFKEGVPAPKTRTFVIRQVP